MNTIAQLNGTEVKDGDLGIEIETESLNRYDVPRIKGWVNKGDGSLRNFGVEYVSNGPVAIGDLRGHLEAWKNGLGRIYNQLDPNSMSTSVHVHVNVQPLTALQTLNFYLCAILLENVMSRFAGEDRVGNLFCLRTKDAENHFTHIKRSLAKADDDRLVLRAFNPRGEDKIYSNIHVIPITRFGSIEFRILRGTLDIDVMEVWARSLCSIREFSKRFNNPLEILSYLKATGPRQVMGEALGRDVGDFMYEGAEMDLVENYSFIADVATCRKSWDIKKFEVKKRVDPFEALVGGVAQGIAENGQRVVWDENYEEEDL